MSYPDAIERKKALQRKRTLQWDCSMGKHKWGSSASPDYEKCQYGWCNAVRKVEHAKPGTRAEETTSTLQGG